MSLKTHTRASWRHACRLALAAALFVGLTPLGVAAQGVGASSIQGKVTDETGGALPGVTVTASSPALQVRQLMEVADSGGQYRFVDLPPGIYRITFELPGFQTVVRDQVRLNAGFVARIDEMMKVGAVEETVTVSGQSPVVDLTTTASSTNFTSETLATVPVVRTMWQLLALTPGVRMTSRLDVGGNTVGTQQGYRSYGTSSQNTPMMDGIDTREAEGSAGAYYDDRTFEDIQIRAVGNDAEMALPGTNFVAIVKSGGNDFRGAVLAAGEWPWLQSNNIDDDLRRQGITEGNPLVYYRDVFGELGGRIVRDKLWFYGAYRNHGSSVTKIGYAKAPGPDRVYGTADDVPSEDATTLTNYTAKLSHQITEKYRAIAFWQKNDKIQPERDGSRFRPAENAFDFYWKPSVWKGEIQGMPSDTVLFDIVVGQWRFASAYDPREDIPGRPTRYDRYTGIYTGPAEDTRRRAVLRWISTGSLSFFPKEFLGGGHSFKIGYRVTNEGVGQWRPNREAGNYMLTYDRVGGSTVSEPAEITTWNLPVGVGRSSRMTEYSGYIKDTWRLGDRLTANLGFRAERYDTWVDEQTKVQGMFGESGSFPRIDVVTWTAVAPRVGLAFDLTGDGKTALKGTYGTFNHVISYEFPDAYNQNVRMTTRYRWRDLDGNNDYTPGEVNLGLNGPDFISISGASNNLVNPDLQQPVTHEFSAGIDRELVTNFSARVLYVYKVQRRLYESVNVLRPYSAYNIPLTRRDPGPDGLLNTPDDAGSVTVYDYATAFRGATFVGTKILNREGRDDVYQTVEITLNKRTSQNWDMLASFLATRNHRWLDGIPESPNDEWFPLDKTWSWLFKASGSYSLPGDLRVSAFLQYLSGNPGQRTYIFRSVDPDGGSRLLQLSTVTLRLEPYGARRLPNTAMLNLRGSKRVRLGGGRYFEFDVDLFNALNANPASSITYASGPTFGTIGEILPPRIVRLGASFTF